MMTLAWLKQSTETYHQSLESLLASSLFAPDLTLESYTELLSAFYQIYADLEGVIYRESSLADVMHGRSKMGMLETDLEMLQTRKRISIPIFTQSFTFEYTNTAETLGGMYVMEGATLGGNHIKKRLERVSWFRSEYFHFFNSYGENRGSMWNSFINFLKEYALKNPKDHNSIQHGAQKTFKFMHSSFVNMQSWQEEKKK